MKYQRHNNTSSLFLLELILAVLFFSVASAFCVQIFIKAHLMSQDARDLNFAVNEISSIAEQLSTEDALQAPATDSIRYYDKAYTPCAREDAVYTLTIHFNEADTMRTAEIEMTTTTDDQSIYALQVHNHIQRRAAQ